MFFKGWSKDAAMFNGSEVDVAPSSFSGTESCAVSFSFLSLLAKSKLEAGPGVLGLFGVLVAPKEANAPEPRPKALEAPEEGDFAVDGGSAPNGFVFDRDEDPSPNLRGV